jgi:hypothetical protein
MRNIQKIREKEIKTIWCGNNKTQLAYFQSPSALDTHINIHLYIRDVICIFYA